MNAPSPPPSPAYNAGEGVYGERGAALLTTIVLSLLLLTLFLWYLSQAGITAKVQSHEQAMGHALAYAETGLGLAEQALQIPGTLASSGTVTYSGDLPNGRFEYTLINAPPTDLTSVSPIQGTLVDAFATGYYYLGSGTEVDPVNNRPAQRAVMRAKLVYQSVAAYVVATPGVLRMHPGSSATGAPVYAGTLNFDLGSTFHQGPPLRVDTALYGDAVKMGDGPFDPTTNFVIFNTTSGPQAVGPVPHFPPVDDKMLAYYMPQAVSDSSHLKDGANLDGPTAPPPGGIVYYCDGDLHLGKNKPFTPSGAFVIYVKGNLFVHNTRRGHGHACPAFLVEKDIIIDPSKLGVARFDLLGNFVANGALKWKNFQTPRGFFFLVGSFLTGQGIELPADGTFRNYLYRQLPDSLLPLPRFTQVLETQIVAGKYRH